MQFRYMGFSQQANIRSYRFQAAVARERPIGPSSSIEFRLRADLSLLANYQVRIQDGPTLCLQILNAGLASPDNNAGQFASYAITREDVSAFASARDAKEEAKMARRKPRPPFKPSPSSQLRWPQVK